MGSTQSIGGLSSETFRLEIERMEIEFTEKLNQQQSRYNHELTILRNQLAESDSHRNILQVELQERSNNHRNESTNVDSDDVITEIRIRHEHEMAMLLEDNKKLIMELDIVSDSNRHLQADRIQLESDLEEMRNQQQAFVQWENQITEIIQWVSDEKDARVYLQALATKMTEELNFLKTTSQSSAEKNWRNRRSQKLDKMELLNLSQNLQSEIQAKTAISDELSRTRVELAALQKEVKETKILLENANTEVRNKESQLKEIQSQFEMTDGGKVVHNLLLTFCYKAKLLFFFAVFERPSSQMSYLEHFLKESTKDSMYSEF